jgi:hypothetical protein
LCSLSIVVTVDSPAIDVASPEFDLDNFIELVAVVLTKHGHWNFTIHVGEHWLFIALAVSFLSNKVTVRVFDQDFIGSDD